MGRTAPILAAALLLFGATTRSSAQTIAGLHDGSLHLTVGGAWTSMWDDESHLGGGALVSGGVEKVLGSHAFVEAELAAGHHHRDAGYLIADGTPILGVGRLAYRFGSPGSAVRPFASAGLGLVHSAGTLTWRGPAGQTRDWSITSVPYEIGAGVSIATRRSIAIGPEFRWMGIGGSGSRTLLEQPMLMLRAGVTLEWRLRT